MSQVLLLNATYEPLVIIPVNRAISLWFSEKVDLVDEARSITVKSAKRSFSITNVVRLKRYVNVPHRTAKWSRRGVLIRDDYTCAYCGAHVGEKQRGKHLSSNDFTIDHVVPISQGGKTSWGNTVCACFKCNQRKGDKPLNALGMRLNARLLFGPILRCTP